MQVEIDRREEMVFIILKDRLDAVTASRLDRLVQEELAQESGQVILDLEGLNYVSSAGLRSLLTLAKLVEGRGGKVAICGLRGEVQKVFELSGFTRIFAVCPRPTV